jgi:hypothetical protein
VSKKNFELAKKANAILITQAKNNQKKLPEEIRRNCNRKFMVSKYSDSLKCKHGRLEKRTYEVFEAYQILEKTRIKWPHIRQIIKVIRLRHEIGVEKKPTISESYYVSGGELSAKNMRNVSENIGS